jgi:hypothetical protein
MTDRDPLNYSPQRAQIPIQKTPLHAMFSPLGHKKMVDERNASPLSTPQTPWTRTAGRAASLLTQITTRGRQVGEK